MPGHGMDFYDGRIARVPVFRFIPLLDSIVDGTTSFLRFVNRPKKNHARETDDKQAIKCESLISEIHGYHRECRSTEALYKKRNK